MSRETRSSMGITLRWSGLDWLSVGTGFKRRRFNFDIAYQFGFGDDAPSQAALLRQDTRSMDAMISSHALLTTIGMHF